jgi:hypothetical protein
MPTPLDLTPVFAAARDILKPYAPHLVTVHDSETEFYLDTAHLMPNTKPLNFASVQLRVKNVTFHLFPLYVYPELLTTISPALAKRMQGKTCFNFTTIDKQLFNELHDLVATGFARYQAVGSL